MQMPPITAGQSISIPDLQFDNGAIFEGELESHADGEWIAAFDVTRKVKIDGRNPNRFYVMTWRQGNESLSSPVLISVQGEGKLSCRFVLDEERESLRLRCAVDVSFSPIPVDQLCDEAESILARVNDLEEDEAALQLRLLSHGSEDEMASEMTRVRLLLERLVDQMDHLTQVVQGRQVVDETGGTHADEALDCSATGIALRLKAPLEPGDFLKLQLDFGSVPRINLEAIGVVVRCQPFDGAGGAPRHYDVAVRYTHIRESDRERIVRHLFKVQRNQLRDRSAAAA